MKTIPLTKGYEALVDDADYEVMSQFNWQVHPGGRTDYAYRIITVDKQRRGLFMHRALVQPPSGMLIDHRDRNGLNNQRANLRCCPEWLNRANKAPNSSSRTGYKGVGLLIYGRHRSKVFQARLFFRGKFYFLGNYATAEEAGRAYDVKAAELFGEFAWLNFPPSDAGKPRPNHEGAEP